MEDAKFVAVLSIVRRALRVVGSDIFAENWRPNVLTVLTLTLVTLFPYMELSFITTHNGSFSLVAEGISLLITSTDAWFSLVEILVNRKAYVGLMEDVCSRRSMYKSAKISALFDEYYAKNIMFCKFLYAVYMSTFSYFLLPAILPDPDKYNLPLPGTVPYLAPTTNSLYWVNFLLQFLMVGMCQHILIAQCSSLIIAIMSACCQIRALKIKLADMNEQINDPSVKSDTVHESLGEIIRLHASTKDYIRRIQRKSSVVYLSVFVTCGGVVCACLNVLAEDVFNSANALMVAAIFSVLVHCFFGNTLLIENDSLPDAIYAVDWYRLPVADQKAFKFLLANAQPDAALHGVLMPLNMGTFVSIMKAAFSYYSILSKEKGNSKQVPSPSDPPVSVSASFTVSAPPSTTNAKSAAQRTGDGGGGGSGEGGGGDGTVDDDSKISVSYTIAAPKGSESSVAATTASAAKEKSKDDAVSTTATFSVPTPAANNLNKKTESDEFTKPTAAIRAPASSFSTSKRSLFDIDNANSLTLAEKLRQEANKYAESDKENFVSSAKSSAKTSSESTAAAAAPANVTPAAAAEGTVLLRKDSSAPSSPLHQHHHQPSTLAERRPSWRLKVDGGSKFKLEDATAPAITPTSNNNNTSSSTALDSSNNTRTQQNELNSISASSLAQRRQNGDSSTFNSTRPASAPELATTTTATSNDASLHLRRSLKSEENKENDKENDNRSSAQATQAVIQRRRRPKRRSTGVVHVDMEDIDPERQDSPVDGEEKESGAERGRSRVGSTASDLAADAQKDGSGVAESKENGGDYVDYKALYEQAKADNEKLKSSMRKKDEEVLSLKSALDRFTTATTKNNSLSELEKRERRAMERKMSEMEEELKQLEALKTENQRLKDENGALIRVISKLSR
ncbi:hypothetical protein pipiens_004305 [Culex pipiens pipiens]|uniref:cGMP-dependent protein kinase interacting domain-containing protein n=1 Tax=Culex pipiens pipiens TaxID=38569 RepID=A0ABD1CK16_CULPP